MTRRGLTLSLDLRMPGAGWYPPLADGLVAAARALPMFDLFTTLVDGDRERPLGARTLEDVARSTATRSWQLRAEGDLPLVELECWHGGDALGLRLGLLDEPAARWGATLPRLARDWLERLSTGVLLPTSGIRAWTWPSTLSARDPRWPALPFLRLENVVSLFDARAAALWGDEEPARIIARLTQAPPGPGLERDERRGVVMVGALDALSANGATDRGASLLAAWVVQQARAAVPRLAGPTSAP